MKMKSVMAHQFSMIPKVHIPRSSFNRSHGYKTTFDAGYLVPIYVDEALPGDTFSLRPTLFCRMSTPIVPVMDNLFMDTFFFAVPIRLIWDNWQRMCGERDNPEDSIDYLVPQVAAPSGGWQVGSLSDYFGLPTGVPNLKVSALWHRAYNLIWNEWFRDQNLQERVPVPKGDGPDPDSYYKLLRRGKRHDYFTSCLPWPQKGPGVELPLGETAEVHGWAKVYGNGKTLGLTTGSGSWLGLYHDYYNFNQIENGLQLSPDAYNKTLPTSGELSRLEYTSDRALGVVPYPGESGLVVHADGLYADLSSATAVTINSLRQAFQIQKLLERDARGGTRYTEIIRSHFGVVSPDARMQRPEYLGGSSTRIIFNPVQQTSSTDSTSPQGNLAAFAYGSMSGHGFTKSFTEHCVIIGLVNVRADLTYQQGIPRMFSRRSRFDFYWPSLAHLGEQAVLNKEIFAQGNEVDEEVFGYQERWAEYRYFPSKITGQFRSTYPQSLDVWHFSQEFDGLPTLSPEFIEDRPPIQRALAVQNAPHFMLDCYFDLKCARPMPTYSIPGYIDHF